LIGLGTWTERDGLKHRAGAFVQGPAVWEKPQFYPKKGGRETEQERTAKANALINLSASGAACANVLSWGRGGVRWVLPREWKRQIPKPMHHRHALTLLTSGELALVAEAFESTRPRKGTAEPLAELHNYIREACIHVARNPGKGLAKYSAGITDLLDAITLGLTEEGRLTL
jgi:hypothetical protein